MCGVTYSVWLAHSKSLEPPEINMDMEKLHYSGGNNFFVCFCCCCCCCLDKKTIFNK